MKLSYEILEKISRRYGKAFYILDTAQFKKNFNELQESFRNYYKNTFIAYSYKTNYIPMLCKINNDLGGYAEVVSDMEYNISKKIGVKTEKVIFNGPYKNEDAMVEIILNGGIVNIDSKYDFEILQKIAKNNKNKDVFIGIRCNYDIYDGVVSRFGFDIGSDSFSYVLDYIKDNDNVHLKGLHCHFATRRLDMWKNKVEQMLNLVDILSLKEPLEYIDLGGGLFGKMNESLKKQFDSYIPSYEEYAEVIAKTFSNYFKEKKYSPKLFIEPGSAIVGDCMKFVAPVVSIKNIRNKSIATLLGSIYNINPTLNKKNPPIKIFSKSTNDFIYKDLDIAGFTCIESDYLYRNYSGSLNVGDYVVFDNVGSYSVVLKPPFILPNFPIVELTDSNCINNVKSAEGFQNIFETYVF